MTCYGQYHNSATRYDRRGVLWTISQHATRYDRGVCYGQYHNMPLVMTGGRVMDNITTVQQRP
jgi:hypothetical protein